MKHIRRYNESSNNDLSIVNKYIEFFNTHNINNEIEFNPSYNEFIYREVKSSLGEYHDGTMYYIATINGKRADINLDKRIELFRSIRDLNTRTCTFISILYYLLFKVSKKDSHDKIVLNAFNIHYSQISKNIIDELRYRIDEFDIIKENGDIDMINVNRLFDFYEVEFNEGLVKRCTNAVVL